MSPATHISMSPTSTGMTVYSVYRSYGVTECTSTSARIHSALRDSRSQIRSRLGGTRRLTLGGELGVHQNRLIDSGPGEECAGSILPPLQRRERQNWPRNSP